MPLSVGHKLGPYEILASIGEGGMGEVWKARDTRLDRIVALKVSKAQFSERFEREARSIAALNHPHICQLYDVGPNYLVMEFVEGSPLKGPMPIEKAAEYAGQILDALDTAHHKGITHRDLKPANIIVTKQGIKLLDFGLAKLKTAPLTETDGTVTQPLTAQGQILGTLQYMSPEQLQGKEADARSDLFSFGCVLYEMLTGKRAFEGQSAASVIAAILEREPAPLNLAPPLERVIRTCLAKDPDERIQTARDVKKALLWAVEPIATSAAPEQRRQRWVGPASALACLLALAIGALAVWLLKLAPPKPVTRFAMSLPPGLRLSALDQPAIAISADGKNLVYVATSGTGTQQLFLRPLDSQESKPVAGTEGAAGPFFSPDGQWVGFFAGGGLKKVSVNGGASVTLANAPGPAGASWGSQGMLALQPTSGSVMGLQEISQEGGTPRPLTRVGGGESSHYWPEFLPGGKAVLFAGSPALALRNNSQIAVQRLGERKNLVQGTQPRFAASGHLLFARSGTLMAAPFDAQRLALTGAAVPALEGIAQSGLTGAAQYSVSSTGTLVYLTGEAAGSQYRLVWVSRNGEEQTLPAPPHGYLYPRVSPDGRRAVVTILEQETQVWVYDVSRDTLTRLTFEGNVNSNPAWSPDGTRIAFGSNRTGIRNLFWQAADGSGGAERLTTSDYVHAANSFSPDGQRLAFIELNPETGRDIWMLNLKDRKAQPFLKTPYDDSGPKFSPDGKWLAYSSDESGRREIYVRPIPGPGGKWQISTNGGEEPVWNPRGGELFYRSGNKMMAVDIDTKSGFSAGKPRMLFEGLYRSTGTSGSLPYYDVSPDGQRFLMLKATEQSQAPTQINVVLNWFEELRRRVPSGAK